VTATDQFAGAGEVIGGDPSPIGRFLAQSHWELVESRPAQLRGTPGRFWLCRHQVRARDTTGRERALSVCIEARRRPRAVSDAPPGLGAAAGLATMVAEVGPHRVWVFPYDPDLPDLPAMASGAAAREALTATGLVNGDEPVAVTAELLRYRAGRRAVAKYLVIPRPGRGHGSRTATPRPGRTFYGKVLRPHRAARVRAVASALHGLHDHAGLRLAIPASHGEGLFVSRAIPGTSLRTRLLDNQSLPSPDRLAAVPAVVAGPVPLDRFPEFDDRRHPTRQVEYAGGLLAHVLPAMADDVGRAVDAVRAGVAAGWAPSALVHGDLYDDQVFVDDDFGLGLVDLDDTGPGDPVLDMANLCAHLLAMAALVPAAAARLIAYRDLVRSAYCRRVGVSPSDFAWREALGLLQLATGPFRVLAPNWERQSGHLVSLAVRLTTPAGTATDGRTVW
jgi:hypothetical protein